jgi:hypothetical protein
MSIANGKYIIGGRVFSTKASIRNHARALLQKQYPIKHGEYSIVDDAADHAFLDDLLSFHHRVFEKKGVRGGRQYMIGSCTVMGGLCFHIQRDEEIEDFSYKRCLEGIPAIDHRTKQPKPVLSAPVSSKMSETFRREIADQIVRYKQKYFNGPGPHVCAVTNTPVEFGTSHVDHHGPDFIVLLHNFLRLQDVDIKSVKTVGSGVNKTLADRSLAEQWKHYHQTHAALRIVLPSENIGKPRSYTPVDKTECPSQNPAPAQ